MHPSDQLLDRKGSRPQIRARSGITLVEIMLSMTLFSMLSLGLFSAVIQTRRMAENSVYESTATTVAMGFLEQMRSMQYNLLADALPTGSASGYIPTKINQGTDDPLYRAVRTAKTILIDTDQQGNPESYMDMWITVDLTDLLASTGLDGIQISLTYEWRNPDTRSIQSRTFKYFRANVP